MHTITVRNVPDEIYQKIKQSAEISHRSINKEIIACIERAIGSHQIDPDLILSKARKSRAKTASFKISDEEITGAKNTGRL
jgi:antitoxin FitA